MCTFADCVFCLQSEMHSAAVDAKLSMQLFLKHQEVCCWTQSDGRRRLGSPPSLPSSLPAGGQRERDGEGSQGIA